VRLDWLAHIAVCKIESCLTTEELIKRIKYARKLSFFDVCKSPAYFWFSFFLAENA